MKYRARYCAVLLSTLFFAAACSERRSALTEVTPTDPARSEHSRATDPADLLARALAHALDEPEVRRHFWESVRDSPFPKHRLHVKSYLRGENGRAILELAARSVGMAESKFLSLLNTFPEMEVVLPAEKDRLQWRGTPDVVVVGWNSDAMLQGELQGYTVSGSRETIPLDTPASIPVIVIRPTTIGFGRDPEATRLRAPKQKRSTISTMEDEFPVAATSECGSGSGIEPVLNEPCTGPGSAEMPGGLVIPSGMTGTCIVPTSGPGDSDADGLLDQCEEELAYVFRPYLAVHAGSGDDLRREEYWAAKKGDTPYAVQILYALSYYLDLGDYKCGGCTGHLGDSEWILIQVVPSGGKWRVTRAKLSSHWNTPQDGTETVPADDLQYPDGTSYGRPRIWVAYRKHANYKSSFACEMGPVNYGDPWGGTDTCSGNSFSLGNSFFEAEVLASANLGNSWAQKITCVGSRETASTQMECYWLPYTFRGWQNQSGEVAGSYSAVLNQHGF